jgi:hypothetical protein
MPKENEAGKDPKENEEGKKDEEDEQDAAGEGSQDQETKDKNGDEEEGKSVQMHGIPKTRFDTINERRRQAEDRVVELEATVATLKSGSAAPATDTAKQPDADAVALEGELKEYTKAYTKAVSEGDEDAAIAAQMKILDTQKKAVAASVPKVEAPSVEAAVEQVNYNSALDDLKKSHPELDETSKKYDEASVIEVNEIYKGLIAIGKPKDVAVRRATAYVLGESEATKTPSAEDTKRNIDDQNRQAPDIDGVGGGGVDGKAGKIDITTISDEDWAALPESKKQELRGDNRV